MRWGLGSLVFVLCLLLAGPVFASDVDSEVQGNPSCAQINNHFVRELDLPGTDLTFPYHVNLNCPDSRTKNLIVVLHGTSRTGSGYFDVVHSMDSNDDGTTLIVAPQFLFCADDHSPCDDGVGNPNHPKRIFWDDNDKWKMGGNWAKKLKRAGHGKTRSSFKVVDLLLKSILKHYPNIRQITMVGHSAGGQFVQRYAAASPLENHFFEAGREMRFVVGNPSSYLYLHPFRRIGGQWKLPAPWTCPSYNQYRYGLEILNPAGLGYIMNTGPWNMIHWYPGRRVTYLLGKNDNRQNGNMDDSCAARLQGDNRLERGKIFYRYMNEFFPGHDHDLAVVPGVGHSAGKLFASDAGRAAIFWWE